MLSIKGSPKELGREKIHSRTVSLRILGSPCSSFYFSLPFFSFFFEPTLPLSDLINDLVILFLLTQSHEADDLLGKSCLPTESAQGQQSTSVRDWTKQGAGTESTWATGEPAGETQRGEKCSLPLPSSPGFHHSCCSPPYQSPSFSLLRRSPPGKLWDHEWWSLAIV